MNKKRNLQILSINIFVLIFFIGTCEIFHRGLTFVARCFIKCDYKLFTLKPYKKSSRVGFSEKDKDLGYIPKKNFKTIINGEGWEKNSLLTINSLGLRRTIKNNISADKILTVGDSFTFGDQVGDAHTWQSCLNKNYKTKTFLNGGVFGYGTSQAILRAQKLYPNLKPSSLIVSTVVGLDFVRDQLEIRDGFPKPYLFKSKNNTIEVVKPKSFDIPNTKFSDKKEKNFIDDLIINFTLFKRFPSGSYFQKRYWKAYRKLTSSINKRGNNPASIPEIIKWSVNKSKKIDPNVTWIIQYTSEMNSEIMKERKLIRKILTQSNINFVDTFDLLHGKKRSNLSKDKIWKGHHTYAGNLIICRAIIDSGIY